MIGLFRVVCLCSACCDLSLHGGGVFGGPGGSGGVRGCCEPNVRPGTGTGGAFTGGLALEEDPDDVGADVSLKDLGAALYCTGLAFSAGARTGAGGGAGVSARGRYALVLLIDRLLVRPTFRCVSVRRGGTLSLLSSLLSRYP